MTTFKVKKYRGFEIHYVNSLYKYDIYNQGLWYNSANTLKEVKEYITAVLWTRRNIPQ